MAMFGEVDEVKTCGYVVLVVGAGPLTTVLELSKMGARCQKSLNHEVSGKIKIDQKHDTMIHYLVQWLEYGGLQMNHHLIWKCWVQGGFRSLS